MDQFNFLDLIIIGIVLFGMFKGFKIGLIQSVIGLVGWFLALVLGSRLAPIFAPIFAQFFQAEVLQLASGFLAVVLCVLVVLHLVATMLRTILEQLKITLLDKIGGAIFTGFRNILVILVTLNLMYPISAKIPVWQSSALVPALLQYAPLAKEFLTKTAHLGWENTLGEQGKNK